LSIRDELASVESRSQFSGIYHIECLAKQRDAGIGYRRDFIGSDNSTLMLGDDVFMDNGLTD
jgi:hypothetical protein